MQAENVNRSAKHVERFKPVMSPEESYLHSIFPYVYFAVAVAWTRANFLIKPRMT